MHSVRAEVYRLVNVIHTQRQIIVIATACDVIFGQGQEVHVLLLNRVVTVLDIEEDGWIGGEDILDEISGELTAF